MSQNDNEKLSQNDNEKLSQEVKMSKNCLITNNFNSYSGEGHTFTLKKLCSKCVTIQKVSRC